MGKKRIQSGLGSPPSYLVTSDPEKGFSSPTPITKTEGEG